MIDQVLAQIDTFLRGNHHLSIMDFSLYIEDLLVDNYDEMYLENAFLTEEINENLPDICALAEPSPDNDPINLDFVEKLKGEYERLLALYREVA